MFVYSNDEQSSQAAIATKEIQLGRQKCIYGQTSTSGTMTQTIQSVILCFISRHLLQLKPLFSLCLTTFQRMFQLK